MATDSAEAILRAARRARRDADRHVTDGDYAASGELFEAIRDADRILRAATARIRQATRPLSVGGYGETYDRLDDSVDRLSLCGEVADEDEDDVAGEQWDAFVESHPELTASTFSDDEILEALRAAIESRTQPWLQGAAGSGDVVEVLLPDATTVRNNRATPVVIRTGKHLARLASEGQVVRLRKKWTKGRGSSQWSLPGIEIAEWWFKQFEIEVEDA